MFAIGSILPPPRRMQPHKESEEDLAVTAWTKEYLDYLECREYDKSDLGT
jgi:hypothetical protein